MAGQNFERVLRDDKREIRNPDEVVWSYASMLSNFLSHSKPNLVDIKDPQYWVPMRWIAGQIHDMVRVSCQSSFVCRYKSGMEKISGRKFSSGQMYGRQEIGEYGVLILGDAVYVDVAEDFPEDLMPGFPDSRQLYFLDNDQSIALSANQTLMGLFAGGSLNPYPRGLSAER